MGLRKAVVGVLWFGICVKGWALAKKKSLDMEEYRVKVIALRDAFVQSVKDAGVTCAIAVPSVLVKDVPSLAATIPRQIRCVFQRGVY